MPPPKFENFFFFNDPATTVIYTLSLHDALPILIQSGHVCDNLSRNLYPIVCSYTYVHTLSQVAESCTVIKYLIYYYDVRIVQQLSDFKRVILHSQLVSALLVGTLYSQYMSHLKRIQIWHLNWLCSMIKAAFMMMRNVQFGIFPWIKIHRWCQSLNKSRREMCWES